MTALLVGLLVNLAPAYLLTRWMLSRASCQCPECPAHRSKGSKDKAIVFRRVPASWLGDVRDSGGGVH